MLDFEVQRGSRRCQVTEREFQPGETYFSVLVADGSQVVRRDIAAEAWSGPPAGNLGWWRSQVPESGSSQAKMAPTEVALELFDRWLDDPAHADAAYVLALLLIRKRVFRFADVPIGSAQRDPGSLEVVCPARAAGYTVGVVEVAPDRADQIQNQLLELLYGDAA